MRDDDKLSCLAMGIIIVGLMASFGLLVGLVIAVAEVVQKILRGLGI